MKVRSAREYLVALLPHQFFKRHCNQILNNILLCMLSLCASDSSADIAAVPAMLSGVEADRQGARHIAYLVPRQHEHHIDENIYPSYLFTIFYKSGRETEGF